MRICFRSLTTSSSERNRKGVRRQAAFPFLIVVLIIGSLSVQTVEAAEQSVWEPLPSAEESTDSTQPAQTEQAAKPTDNTQPVPAEQAASPTENTQPAQAADPAESTESPLSGAMTNNLPDLQQLPGELAETIRETGEEVINEAVEEAKAEVQAKAKEVKRNFLVRLWEHIKKMFHDFFASIFS